MLAGGTSLGSVACPADAQGQIIYGDANPQLLLNGRLVVLTRPPPVLGGRQSLAGCPHEGIPHHPDFLSRGPATLRGLRSFMQASDARCDAIIPANPLPTMCVTGIPQGRESVNR